MTDGPHRVDLDSAERIVRALVGVSDVRIDGAADGRIARVRVAPEPGAAQRDIALNVASALRATLGVSLAPEAVLMGPIANGNGHHNGNRNGNGNGNGHAPAAAPPREAARSPSNGRAPHAHAAVRLEQAELARRDGRVRCRVVLTAGGERFDSAADAPDVPGEDLRLAARVTADALRNARAVRPLQVDDATITQVAGRPHAVVALRIWDADDARDACAVEAVGASPESAAARAVIRAALSADN